MSIKDLFIHIGGYTLTAIFHLRVLIAKAWRRISDPDNKDITINWRIGGYVCEYEEIVTSSYRGNEDEQTEDNDHRCEMIVKYEEGDGAQ